MNEGTCSVGKEPILISFLDGLNPPHSEWQDKMIEENKKVKKLEDLYASKAQALHVCIMVTYNLLHVMYVL